MAVDNFGNPIFATEALPLSAGLTLPTPAAVSSPLQGMIDSLGTAKTAATPTFQDLISSIKAPQLPTVSDSSSTLSLLLNTLGSRTSSGTGGGSRASTTASGKSSWVSQIKQLALRHGLDPHAVLAVASVEGLSGGVGDSGTSFGPFQLRVGGALPAGKGKSWAESPAGIKYAIQRIASVAKGLKGEAAIRAIVTQFERPANPTAEIQKARDRYGTVR